MISIMLVTRSEDREKLIREYIKTDKELEVSSCAKGGEAAMEKIENTSPDVLIITASDKDPDGLSIAERVIALKPRTFVILLADELTVEFLTAAGAVGCHNVTQFPGSAAGLCSYIHRVCKLENGRISALDSGSRVVWASKVITVFSPKGGLGKTTVACNLAVELAARNKKVALVDLDLQFGDVHVFMDIEPKETIADMAPELGTMTIDSIRTYMNIHESGVSIICAPKSPEYAEAVSAEKVQTLISLLRSYYDFVIVDTATNFSDVTLSAIEASNLLLFITGLDISILRNSKIAMSILESLGQKKKVRTVINRAVEISSISMQDVQRIVDAPILSRLPSDYMLAVSALNRGQPFCQSTPAAKLSVALSDMAEKITGGADNFDIQQLSSRQRRALMKKYGTREKIRK